MSYLPGNVYWAQLAEYFSCIKDTCSTAFEITDDFNSEVNMGNF